MKILVLYSDVDDFIITCLVATTAVTFLLNWVNEKLKSQKKDFGYFSEDD